MATALIQNGAMAGAMAGLALGNSFSSIVNTDYAKQKDVANAIATEVAAACVTAGVADADKAAPTMQVLAQAITMMVIAERGKSSTTATDWLKVAGIIAAMMKEAEADLT